MLNTSRRSFSHLFVLALVLFSALMPLSPAAAQETAPPEQVFSFSQLGYTERILLSPYDIAQISFGLPASWELTADSFITLRLNFASNRVGAFWNGDFPAGTLQVRFNGVLLKTISLTGSGSVVEEIRLSPESLKPASADGRHRLSFVFDARFACDDRALAASLIIGGNSTITLRHRLVALQPDLTLFPRPFYQAGSILPSQTVLVVPDSPSEAELRAALLVSAGLGALTGGNLSYRLLPAAQAAAAQNLPADFILVGLPASLPLFERPAPAVSAPRGAWAVEGMGADDGLLQLAVSWNAGHWPWWCSGNSEAGLVKAAQALSAGKLAAPSRPDVAVISQVNPSLLNENVPEDQTLFSLGYDNTTLGGFEGHAAFFFPASADQVLSTGGRGYGHFQHPAAGYRTQRHDGLPERQVFGQPALYRRNRTGDHHPPANSARHVAARQQPARSL